MAAAVDLSTYSDADLEALRVQVRAEQEARARAAAARVQADALVEAITSGRVSDPVMVTRPDGATYSVSISASSGPVGPSEWVSGATYAAGAEVTYDGRRYEALTATAGQVPPPDATGVWQGL
ncbi:MAG: hypothetical protein HOV76_24430 [Hamadaea sp.]|nr:hypothetical protein [Hamadaea sp.]